jgi:hypothetical protein
VVLLYLLENPVYTCPKEDTMPVIVHNIIFTLLEKAGRWYGNVQYRDDSWETISQEQYDSLFRHCSVYRHGLKAGFYQGRFLALDQRICR